MFIRWNHSSLLREQLIFTWIRFYSEEFITGGQRSGVRRDAARLTSCLQILMIILALAVSLWAATKQKDAWKPSSLLFPPLFILCIEETGKFLIYFYICTVSSLIKKIKVNHFKLNCKTNEPISCQIYFESIQFTIIYMNMIAYTA